MKGNLYTISYLQFFFSHQLPPQPLLLYVDDSKKLTAKLRE